MLKKTVLLFITFIAFLSLSLDAQARRGCCSHHGGVNYCDRNQGQLVCNDGTYSPTCGCETSTKQDKNESIKNS